MPSKSQHLFFLVKVVGDNFDSRTKRKLRVTTPFLSSESRGEDEIFEKGSSFKGSQHLFFLVKVVGAFIEAFGATYAGQSQHLFFLVKVVGHRHFSE